jgi:hypothetical protein
MALEQEVDGSSQAESGKDDKQDQVHRVPEKGPEPGKQSRPVRRRSL